jgi:hypothetical protein
MTGDADFAYAQARIQARHGTRLAEHEWRRLEATHDVAQYLQVLRGTSRARWAEPLAPNMDSHALEARLRAEWRAYAREVARFQPDAWREAVAWTAFLVDVPVIDHWLREGFAHSWMAQDELYAPWCMTDAQGRERALDALPIAALLRHGRSGLPALRAWFLIWRGLWPRAAPEHARGLDALARTVEAHVSQLRSARGESSFELRSDLKQRVAVLFRRHFETVAATIAHLLLEALDLERLRAGLVRRLLLETAPVEGA